MATRGISLEWLNWKAEKRGPVLHGSPDSGVRMDKQQSKNELCV